MMDQLAGVSFATIGGRSLKKGYREIQWKNLKNLLKKINDSTQKYTQEMENKR